MSIEWGPWITNRLPELGDWIQVYCEYKPDRSRTNMFEGLVTKIDDEFLYLSPHGISETSDWSALQWRHRILKDPNIRSAKINQEIYR